MGKFDFRYEHFCRWCNQSYNSKKPHPSSGFCSTAHKQAHYRAYKKYVTGKKPAQL